MQHLIPAAQMLLTVLFLVACSPDRVGSVKGQILPAGAGARIAALDQGKTIGQAEANPHDGTFSFALPAGTYDIRITSHTAPFPLSIAGVVVRSGETTTLTPMWLSASAGTGRISGKVLAAATGAHVTLFAEGIERASVNTTADRKYEFEGLPSGRYALHIESPGYAKESLPVNVSDNQRTSMDVRLLYITLIEGIDWNTGKARSRGIGLPPKQDVTPTVRRELAKRAALADAERNMLRMLELIKIAPDQKLSAFLGEGAMTKRLSGFLQGYRIAAERDLDGGKIEIEIELPLTGPGGLSSHLRF